MKSMSLEEKLFWSVERTLRLPCGAWTEGGNEGRQQDQRVNAVVSVEGGNGGWSERVAMGEMRKWQTQELPRQEAQKSIEKGGGEGAIRVDYQISGLPNGLFAMGLSSLLQDYRTQRARRKQSYGSVHVGDHGSNGEWERKNSGLWYANVLLKYQSWSSSTKPKIQGNAKGTTWPTITPGDWW